MSRVAEIIWKSIGIGVTAMILATSVWLGYSMAPQDQPCRSLRYIYTDSAQRMYIAEGELDRLLRTEGIHPVGTPVDSLPLQRIENTIRRHPMVRRAECYVTPRNELRIRITQRVPLLRVQTPGDHYLIDTDRRMMEARASVTDTVLVVTGSVGPQAAATQLADFALWLQDDAYWHQRIRHLHMRSPRMAVAYVATDPAVPRRETAVVLGEIDRYEPKLAKLRTYISKGAEATADKNYTELDIRFRGQVIGRR